MLDFELLRDKGILIVTPHGPLEKADFERVAKEVDLYLAKDGMLSGVMLYAQGLPPSRRGCLTPMPRMN